MRYVYESISYVRGEFNKFLPWLWRIGDRAIKLGGLKMYYY